MPDTAWSDIATVLFVLGVAAAVDKWYRRLRGKG